MPAPLLIPLGIKAVCWCTTLFATGYVCKKGHDAYKHGQKTKQEKYALKTKSLETAREENKRLTELENKLLAKEKLSEENIKNFGKEIGEVKKELADPKITEKRQNELLAKLAFIQTQLDDENKQYKKIRDELDKIAKDRKKNNDIIANAGSNPDDNHWIWQFMTMENIMIMGACYAMYTLLKDDKGK